MVPRSYAPTAAALWPAHGILGSASGPFLYRGVTRMRTRMLASQHEQEQQLL